MLGGAVVVIVLFTARLLSVTLAVIFENFGEVDTVEVSVLISSVLVAAVNEGVIEDDVYVTKVVALVDVEDKVAEVVIVFGMVELVVRSVSLKCGLVYSLSFENLVTCLTMGSLKERLVNPRPPFSP